MNTPINDGGPAFPCGRDVTLDQFAPSSGLSLRDYFAAQALTNPYTDSDSYPEKTAEWAYQIADAMIKARGAA